MISERIFKFALVILCAGLLAPFVLVRSTVSAHPPMDATPVSSDFKNAKTLKDPCALDANNLITNGSMAPGHDTQYGSVADAWEPFIFDGAPPQFQWVGNEQIDPNGSQQIVSTSTFDAGIYQTVRNLQPGVYYWFRLGYSLAAKSLSGPNVRVDSIGRKVGFDPLGGTDPKSPNVIWGPDLFDGNAALNRIEMILVFPARSPNVTIFLRAIARDGSSGENRVWLDAACMEARHEMPTATPPPATATPSPSVPPTRPPTTRAPATKIAQGPTSTSTPVPATPTITDTPTPVDTATPSPSPRYAHPEVTPTPSPPIDPGTSIAAGVGALFILGAILFFGIGILWWTKTNRGQ